MLQPKGVFFAYPSRPESLRETIETAAELLARTSLVTTKTWEQLKVSGRVVIDQIVPAIEDADLVVFEITDLNENVMFELGFAIGRGKAIWPLRDTSIIAPKKKFDDVGILRTIGYETYTSSQDILGAFLRDTPTEDPRPTVFEQSIRPALVPFATPSVLYIPSLYETDAGLRLTNRLRGERLKGLRFVYVDANEQNQPLVWYASEIYSAGVVVVHFTSRSREGADVHNSRSAFIAGLAYGMDRPLLMLAEEDYLAPIDYRDLLHVYPNARELDDRLGEWLELKLAKTYEELNAGQSRRSAIQLTTDLRGLRLGEQVAEYEVDVLNQYFVDTASSRDAIAQKTNLFVGRRGVGKTANLFHAAETLRDDPRNLVVLIKPVSYEWEGLVRILERFYEPDTRGYLLQALWKFLLHGEIARTAMAEIESKAAGIVHGTAAWDLAQFMEKNAELLRQDFAVRLQRALAGLEGVTEVAGVGDNRQQIAQALHDEVIRELRKLLGRVLRGRQRVALLIDNLDAAWKRGADFEQLSAFLIGLLVAIRDFPHELRRDDFARTPIPTTISVFLRSDIYAELVKYSREPDKLPTSRIAWTDSNVLLRVVEDRYSAARGGQAAGKELWDRYFCDSVDGVPTRDYIAARVLPRPRDLVLLCNTAIAAAGNRAHAVVEADDIKDGERLYSRFAFEALQVEDVVGEDLESVVFEFLQAPAVLNEEVVLSLIANSKTKRDPNEVLGQLKALLFLGLEIREAEFAFEEDPRELPRIEALARQLAERRGSGIRMLIHPAFRPYLDVLDPKPTDARVTVQ